MRLPSPALRFQRLLINRAPHIAYRPARGDLPIPQSSWDSRDQKSWLRLAWVAQKQE